MADTPICYIPSAGTKRSRNDADDDDEGYGLHGMLHERRFEKKARPTSGESSISDSWVQAQDSVLNTPKSIIQPATQKPHWQPYDSDDQDSMTSEPGSPPDIAMSSADEDMEFDDDTDLFSPAPIDGSSRKPLSEPWHAFQTRMQQTNRVPTPILPPSSPSRPGIRPIQVRTGMKQHVRHRHPQEIYSNSSDLLEVPSPIDEDEVPTPPSAAEAAGSQLSMLTVNDMDMVEVPESALPTISIDPSPALPYGEQHHVQQSLENESAIADGFEPMDAIGDLDASLIVRKQRARSGALSAGHGSPSPAHAGAVKRTVSVGFRADCEKCQMRVPGHMNHFVS